jgi:hypothetical protein
MSAQRETDLDLRLKAVWRREQGVRLSEGALVFLRWSMLLFVAAVTLDWLIEVPVWGRVVLLGVVLGVPFVQAWKAGWRLVRPFNAAHTALQIEKQLGGLESLLVSAVQLRDTTSGAGASEALAEYVCKQAAGAVSGLKPDAVVRLQTLRRPAVLAIAVVLFLGLLSLSYGPLLSAGAGRIFTPWLAINYPTRTHLEVPKGALVVQEGAPVKITARVSGVIPRQAKIALRTGKGAARVRNIDVVKGTCGYTIDTAFRSFEYRLMAGDARSDWQEVKVIPAPAIERAEVKLEYPAYTERPVETVEALTLTVPETTKINWVLKLDQAVKDAKLNLPDEKSTPMKISEDGRTVSFQQNATESLAYGFTWTEKEHGFSYTSPTHYLQVAPDQPPSVELISPLGNVYATLGRKMDLVFRGRDDHGVAECLIAYRVDKTEETKVSFKPASPVDGREQPIDWDYRTVLPDLAVGQTVSFAIEVADRYPGAEGPHRVRSEARRIQFLSVDDYLAQVEKQRKRLLSQLRIIYREEREVSEAILKLDPADAVFVQTCQLEAVRQDLMRERLKLLAAQLLDLTEDLAANSISNALLTASLVQLRTNLVTISTEHVSQAASALRELASETGVNPGKGGKAASSKVSAAQWVNSSARELGLLVLDLGYQDAAEVMAYELHAAAQTQAALRTRSALVTDGAAELATEQEGLGKWLARLFQASPRGKESTIEEALVEFTLTRMVKQMVNGGMDQRFQKVATLLREGNAAEAMRLQSEVIQALLKAEFRLRVGSEREALAIARDQFLAQIEGQKKLRAEIKALDDKVFKKRCAEFSRTQRSLHRNIQLLLMPEIPARRTRLFDDVVPSAPPVAEWLGLVDEALAKAATSLAKGDREAAETAQKKAEELFVLLADAATKRIATLTQQIRIDRLAYGAQEVDKTLARFAELQLSILERTEDAAADKSKSVYLGDEQQTLAATVDEFRLEMVNQINSSPMPNEHPIAMPVRLEEAFLAMEKATPLLRDNKPGEAAPLQDVAVEALVGARGILKEHGTNLTAYAAIVGATDRAVAPGPYVAEIEEEQRDMFALTKKSKLEELPSLAIPQKNLVHAVGAVVLALDPIAHLVESGTVMVFAKDDMASAGTALETKDSVEALDAQDYIIETLSKLRGRVNAVIPQYQYVMEIVEALQEHAQKGLSIREDQRKLRVKTLAKKDIAGLAKEQGDIKARAVGFGKVVNKIMGMGLVDASVGLMTEAELALKEGNTAAAATTMAQVEKALKKDAGEIGQLLTLLAVLLDPPEPGKQVSEEMALLKKVLAMAAEQKKVYRESFAANPEQLAGFEPKLRAFETRCDPFIALAQTHKNPVVVEPTPKKSKKGAPVVELPPPTLEPLPPANLQVKLVAAKESLAKAASSLKSSDRVNALASQDQAIDKLNHFMIEYTLKFFKPASGASSGDPVPTDAFKEQEDSLSLFMPGAVTGKRPPDGKLEWEVLGRRDRAALNENFARELPLEYRAILKDYYERLAK